MNRRLLLASLMAGACTPAQVLTNGQVVDARTEVGGRLSVPVEINGSGPYRFIVDSAANATLIAADLATTLNLRATADIFVNTLVARERMAAVVPASFQSGVLRVENPRLGVASRAGLHGADGLLGSDFLKDLKLVMNFRGRTPASIRRSGKEHVAFLDGPRPSTRLLDRGERHLGGPISIGVYANGVRGRAIIDTGAETSIINTAMAATGARPILFGDGSREKSISSPTGSSAPASVAVLPSLKFAGVSLQQVPVLAGSFHVFDFWGIGDQPAMLMGVDILGLFRSVSVDLRRAEVVIEL